METLTLEQRFTFEAAHRLPNLPPEHKCYRLHGHSFHISVRVQGPMDEQYGWVMDYADIRKIVKPIIEETLDHRYLNEVEGLENPTSENLARWLWQRIRKNLPNLCEIIVGETCNSSCSYRG